MIVYTFADISTVPCEVMVNASNGRGYMGGKACVRSLRKGVAESMQYATKGLIEREAKSIVRSRGFIPTLFGLKAGDWFCTNPCGLPCEIVFHAVTMRNPASRSSLEVVNRCLLRLKNFCVSYGFKDVCLPYLGCGNGGISKKDFEKLVKIIFCEDFWSIRLINKI